MFRAYREAVPDREPGSNFMPELWARIEARQRTTAMAFGLLAKRFVTAAFALCIVFSVLLVVPMQSHSQRSSLTYVEVLDQAQLDTEAVDVEVGGPSL